MATFMPGGTAPAEGSLMRFPALAETLRRIGTEGPDSFYRGALARDIAADLAAVGAPVTGRISRSTRPAAVLPSPFR